MPDYEPSDAPLHRCAACNPACLVGFKTIAILHTLLMKVIFFMDTTKVAVLSRARGGANDIARGHVGTNRRDSRIFGSSWRSDYIFSVR